MVWNGVTARFKQFDTNLRLTNDQISDGTTKHKGITKCLNTNYYEMSSETSNSMLVGSWGKQTRMRPPRDIDLLYELPTSVYHRFEKYIGNKQSALLQEIKGVLEKTYPSTAMRADGQVIIVRFNTINVEVVPAFPLTNGQYWICDTNNGRKYKEFDAVAEIENMKKANNETNGNARFLTKFMKAWQRECSVPIKSFWIELLAIDFLSSWPYKQSSPFYHDWMTRDFLKYLCGKKNSHIVVPGTYEYIGLGDDWFSRAETAHNRAVKAEQYEYRDEIQAAGEEWQKIFGSQIPIHV
ncbi:MAG: hypothetical protein J0G36_16455 [Afipia sp.]|nr:hypothetical protein [Afipia sp.]